ncbi:MAG: hypothetical protein HBSIN02_16270 [Bacteroidia bacterium]|nr:MAG: hypothetical protein HBSIN02_16270 [Bacteroidia bacterium]
MKRLAVLTLMMGNVLSAQDTALVRPKALVAGGIYDKPFITRLGGRTVIGGYTDVVGVFARTAGINEGWSFEARRFNFFTYSVVSEGIVVTSEIEIEHGAEEIRLEYGLVDIALHDAVNFRGGVILSPLGKTNLVHDSPRLELIERPLAATEIIPSTLSEVGVGFFGAFYPSDRSRLTYEIYAVNGFTQDIIEDTPGTRIAAGKNRLFEEDNNGEPAVVGRMAFSPVFGSELGLSFHAGAYNVFSVDGLKVDDRRMLTILAVDAEHSFGWINIQAEYVHASIDLQPSLRGIFAGRQYGYSVETHVPFGSGLFSRWLRSHLTASARVDFVDFDADVRGDDHVRTTLGLNLRFTQDVALKLNYELNWMRDREGNQERGMRMLLGLASYF